MTLRLVSNAWPSRRLAGGPPPLPGAVACPCTQVAQKEEAEAEAKAAEAAALAKAAKIKAMVEGKGSAAAEAAAAAAAASVTSADEEDHSRAPWHFPPVYAALLRRQGPKRRGGASPRVAARAVAHLVCCSTQGAPVVCLDTCE